jgi:hypothetical protein
MFNVSKSNLTTLRGKFELAKHIWTSPEEQQKIQKEIDKIA